MIKERKNSAQKSPEILLVEDSLTQAEQIKHLLESYYYKVSVAQNGKQALDQLTKHKPSLVISDIVMPEMNGYELCKKIKSNKSTEDIPVILLTRLTDAEEIIEGLSCGADSFITKPYNEKHLLSNIEEFLSKGNRKDHKKVPFGVQILFKGKKRFIQTEQQNVIKLMLDIYEGAIHQNERLVQTEGELRLLNERLESLVEDRTSDLAAEIKLSNQIAERLKESEERYRNLYNDAVVGLYRTNSQGEILLANRALVKMLGFQSFEELAKRNLKKTGYGPSYQRQQFIDQIEKEGEVKDLEAIWICRDGKEIFVRESAKAICDSEGKILYYDGSMEDITEQKRAAEALHKIQHLFETLALVSPVGIFRTDPEGNTTYVNPKWSELSGLTLEEAAGFNWLNAVHPDDKEKLKENWLTNFKSRKTSNAEYRFLKPDGSVVWVMGNAAPEWIDDKIVGYIGTITDITESKQAEIELRKSEEKYHRIFENVQDMYYEVLIDGTILEVSPSIGILSKGQYQMDDLIGKSMFDFYSEPKERQALLAVLQERGAVIDFEITLKNRDGSHIPCSISSKICFDAQGRPEKIIGSMRDITRRKQVEEVLRESESSLRNAQEIAKMGNWEWDIVAQKTHWSDNYFTIHGYKPDEVEPSFELFRNMIHPDDVHLLDEKHAIIMKDKTPSSFELRLTRPDGTVKWIQNNISPVVEDDKLVKLKGVIIDITERKQAEKALRESEVRYKTLFFNAAEGIIVAKTETMQFLYANPTLCKMFGYTEEELMRLGVKDIHPKESLAYVLAEFEAQMRGEKTLVSDLPCQRKDGTLFHADIRTTSMVLDGFKCNVGFFIDITERKQTENAMKLAKEKAEASDKLKTTFLNNISHEVRTPLNGILGFAEIMSQADLSEEEKNLSLSMLFESSDRLLNTITNYMDISLITSRTMSLYKKDFLPGQVLREKLAKYKIMCSIKNLDLSLKIPEKGEEISIYSDPEILRKIMANLLNNAIKFTEKGSIDFGYEINRNELEFFVKDTGIGIGKESLKDIFEHFVKEDRGPLKITEGSGLGLSISKGLVELLGGKIRLESETGKGSAFFFTVPVEKEFENHIKSPSAVKQERNKTINSILVAEDDETNFFYLKALLKHITSAGIIHASNGREAIEKFKENPDIGLILMDIKMPVMDGLEATRQIKAINRNIPVIAITAYAMAGDEARILDAGCDYYLVKPINKKLLLDKMAEFIEI
jgi:PAS domain S-box-containing protein